MILSIKALTAGLLIATAQIDPTPVDQQRAEMYFREAKGLCDRDNGRLWGVSLCGPMVFADVRIHECTYRVGRDALGRICLDIHSRIEASTGVLVSLDRATLTLPGPFRTEGRTLIGDGWTVTLASGWVVRSGPRLSDSQVVRDGR